MSAPVSALISQNVTSWLWTSDTTPSAVATGDVNGDGTTEIVTAGYYLDGSRYNAQLSVWNGATLASEGVSAWCWPTDTQVSCVAIGDVNGDGHNEIVTGGEYFDGTNWNAQLSVWNGTTLALIGVTVWRWPTDTQVSSVAIGDVNGDGHNEIVVGGAYFDGTNWNAQLSVWNGTTLAFLGVTVWKWTSDTYINSVAVANITGSLGLSIVTGGAYFDGTRYVSQLSIWSGTSLALQKVTVWYWTGDTQVTSVAVANVTGGTSLDIITGGSFFDGTRLTGLLHVWNSSTLAVEGSTAWFTIANTTITSVAVGNYSGGNSLDIITGGTFYDGSRNNAQLIDWNGATLTSKSSTSWFVLSDTRVNSVAIGNFGLGNRVVACGSYFDHTSVNAQLSIWG